MKKGLLVLDIEVLPNYFLLAVKGLKSGKVLTMDMCGRDAKLLRDQRKKITSMLVKYTSFGFNSNKYDMPLINLALGGANCYEIYKASKDIIEKNMPDWMTYKNLDIEQRPFDHFDISEPAPAVMISLKNYGTRAGSKKLQEFYLDPHKDLDPSEILALKDYCENDLNVTIDLYRGIEDRIALRVEMSEQYGMDLRSKSDAQIANMLLDQDIKKVTGKKPTKPKNIKPIKYKKPDYIKFDTPELNEVLSEIEGYTFGVKTNGNIDLPKELLNKKIKVGSTVYKIGGGGIHAVIKQVNLIPTEDEVLIDADVTSLYPSLIIQNEFYPTHIGKAFLNVYSKIYDERVKAKFEMKRIKND